MARSECLSLVRKATESELLRVVLRTNQHVFSLVRESRLQQTKKALSDEATTYMRSREVLDVKDIGFDGIELPEHLEEIGRVHCVVKSIL